ncbi:MAG: alanine dehydrogenase [Planctomycetota bacterium]|nr:MAG: alanine dehydrogenase [Planctomycetota bacterium]
MIVGIPREIKSCEYRVGMVPGGVDALVKAGHTVLVESGAGVGSGIADEEYAGAGAEVVSTPEEVWERAELIVKVKEPLPPEYPRIEPRHTIFTFFHFAASQELTDAMIATGASCIAYETMEDEAGRLPLLTPMSEVAGRMAIQEGAKYLEKPMMGRGILLGGVPGVEPAHVVIIGGGVVGTNAAKVAAGLGARVVVLDIDLERLRYLDDIMPPNVTTLYSNQYNIHAAVMHADLVVGAVLATGARAPVLVPRSYLREMKNGAVIVDVAVDQGGCVESIRPTTHDNPTYVVDGVVHYGVANMPGAVGRTSTYALTNATLPWALRLASAGWREAARRWRMVATGLNIVRGRVTRAEVAATFGYPTAPLEEVLASASEA